MALAVPAEDVSPQEEARQRRREAMQERRHREYARLQAKFTGEKPSLLLYMMVGMIALFKDLTDFVFGALPGVGSAIALVLGFGITTTIYLLLMVFDRSGGAGNLQASRLFLKRLLILIGTVLVDMLPLLSFLPMTTLSVIILYSMAKRAWKKSQAASV